ncbi:MAG: fibronectin type III domain-containing protein [Opitutaceae bacterium]|nr:fibronectin type III domain-containing protein [Opitutaceae bacterium]
MNIVSIRPLLHRAFTASLIKITVAAALLLPFCGSAQIAMDVVTAFATAVGDRTVSHAGSASNVKGVLVLISSPMNTNQVLGVTYGGLPMTRVALSPALVAGEGGLADIWFLGAGVPQGTQNVAIDVTSTETTAGAVITFTATADTTAVDTKKVENTSILNPSVTLVTPTGVQTFVCGVLFSGQDGVGGIAAGSGYTEINEIGFGTSSGGTSRLTNLATGGNVVYNWTQAANDAAMIAIAIRQVAAPPPPAPTGLTATAVSSSQIDLTWTDVADETSYKIERSPAGAGSWTQVGTNAANDVTFSDTGLPANTAFDYRVKASNANGDSGPSNVATATTFVAPPPAPTGLTATAVSSSQIDLTWTDVAGETSYKIERSPAGTGSWTQVGTNVANAVTFSNTGLPAGTSFDYRVKASNAGGDSAPSNVATATTFSGPPPAPTGLVATAVSASEIFLTWTDVASETSYKIERSPAGAGSWTQVGTNAANDVDFLDGGLPASTSFDYRVKASNASGDSAPSNVATATTDSGQLALDVATSIPYGTGDRTISHAPLSASVKGVVLLVHSPAPTYTVLGATYGGVPMTHAPLSPALVAGEGGWADIWFLGTGVPQGTQNVVIDLSGTQATVGAIISLTATADTQLVDTKKVENTSIANPSVTLVTPAGVETFVCGVLFSGRDAVTNITPGTGYTAINEYDYGTETGGTSRRTSNATGGNVIYDWVQTADDAAMIAIAIRQSSGGAPPPAPTGLVATAVSSSQIDLTWTDVTGETSYKIERSPAGAGNWAQIGTNAANDVTFSDTGLPASTSFDYRVKSSNANGDSAPSNVASATTLSSSGYTFPTTPYTFPLFAGMVNVKDYGATGNGTTDDTAFIQNAITSNIGSNNLPAKILYFPNGTYLVSDQLKRQSIDGEWRGDFYIQGESESGTIIKLKNNATGYQSPGSPKAVIYYSSFHFTGGGYPNWATNGEGNEAYRNYLADITISTGSGNTGAVGVDGLMNNGGGLRRVTIRSEDGQGVAGLTFTRLHPGPSHNHRVTIIGFSWGLDVSSGRYGITFEHLKLSGQTTTGIRNSSNLLHIRGLISTNSVPVLDSSGQSSIVILDGVLGGGAAGLSAITQSSPGKIFARDVTSTGYARVLTDQGTNIPGTSLTEYATGPMYSQWPTTIQSVRIPIVNTPEAPYGTLSGWTNAAIHGVQGDIGSGQEAAIQAAIDSGATKLYFETSRRHLGDTVHIRNNVTHIVFNQSLFELLGTGFNNEAKPVFRIESTVPGPIVIEHMRGYANRTTQPGVIWIENVSGQTVVFKDTFATSYRNATGGTGNLFLDNNLMSLRSVPVTQNIWSRQHDQEFGGVDGGMVKTNGDFWILGLKTERIANPAIIKVTGGRLEVLGGFILPIDVVPTDRPAFEIVNATASLTFATTAGAATADYTVHVRETRDGVTRDLLRPSLGRHAGEGSWVPLYRDGNP